MSDLQIGDNITFRKIKDDVRIEVISNGIVVGHATPFCGFCFQENASLPGSMGFFHFIHELTFDEKKDFAPLTLLKSYNKNKLELLKERWEDIERDIKMDREAAIEASFGWL